MNSGCHELMKPDLRNSSKDYSRAKKLILRSLIAAKLICETRALTVPLPQGAGESSSVSRQIGPASEPKYASR